MLIPAAAVLAWLCPGPAALAQGGAPPGISIQATPAPTVRPAAAPAGTPAVSAAPASVGEIIQRAQASLALVEGREGAGSGFLCELDGQKFLVTNAHVLAGNSQVNITRLDGSPLRVGAAASAVGHDLIRLAVAPDLPAFSPLERVNETLLVGDDVLVLGNEKGAHVITPIRGKVVGLGPNLVEVDAPFQPGNSGSPIIQVKSGQVVGIATFARQERDDEAGRNPPPARPADPRLRPGAGGHSPAPAAVRLRRFGYRLDSVKAWQPVAWPEFQAEAALIKKVDERTRDIVALMNDLNTHQGHFSTGAQYGATVQRPVQDFFDAMSHHPSPADALEARQRLLDTLRRDCQMDLADAQPRLRYDYFQRDLAETGRYREGMAKAFDRAFQAQVNNTGR